MPGTGLFLQALHPSGESISNNGSASINSSAIHYIPPRPEMGTHKEGPVNKVRFIVTDDSDHPSEIDVSAKVESAKSVEQIRKAGKGKLWRVSDEFVEAHGEYMIDACVNWIKKRFPTVGEVEEAKEAAGKPFESTVRELFGRGCTEHLPKFERTQRVSIPAHTCTDCVRLALEKASKAEAPPETSTQGSKLSSADLCRANGWNPGILLVGDGGRGGTLIKVTAIGEKAVTARIISQGGESVEGDEAIWDLRNRSWRVYGK